MKKIIVLGHKGMLGHMVVKYFTSKGYDVITIQNRYEPSSRSLFFEEILQHPDSIVINAIGRIKQKSEDTNDLLWANAILPLDLTKNLHPTQTLIHPSTDCVFDGLTDTPYPIHANQNAKDDYGWSKQLGETAVNRRNNTIIVRVSIIGVDNNPNPKGLLGWFLSQPENSKLNGFTNHYWNGITTLEWCKIVDHLISEVVTNAKTQCITLQPGTNEHYTKCEMLNLFNEIFETTHSVTPVAAEQRIDRRLSADIIAKDLKGQLIDLKNFNDCK